MQVYIFKILQSYSLTDTQGYPVYGRVKFFVPDFNKLAYLLCLQGDKRQKLQYTKVNEMQYIKNTKIAKARNGGTFEMTDQHGCQTKSIIYVATSEKIFHPFSIIATLIQFFFLIIHLSPFTVHSNFTPNRSQI